MIDPVEAAGQMDWREGRKREGEGALGAVEEVGKRERSFHRLLRAEAVGMVLMRRPEWSGKEWGAVGIEGERWFEPQ